MINRTAAVAGLGLAIRCRDVAALPGHGPVAGLTADKIARDLLPRCPCVTWEASPVLTIAEIRGRAHGFVNEWHGETREAA